MKYWVYLFQAAFYTCAAGWVFVFFDHAEKTAAGLMIAAIAAAGISVGMCIYTYRKLANQSYPIKRAENIFFMAVYLILGIGGLAVTHALREAETGYEHRHVEAWVTVAPVAAFLALQLFTFVHIERERRKKQDQETHLRDGDQP